MENIEENKKKSIIIDIYGGPGSGKSSTAKMLSGLINSLGYTSETPEEYPKYLIHKEDFKSLSNQIGIFSEHKLRIDSLLGKYDFIISDSPTLMQNIYIKDVYGKKDYKLLRKLVKLEHQKHNDRRISFFLNRKHNFKEIGRVQNEEQALEKSKQIKRYLIKNEVDFIEYDTHFLLGLEILQYLKNNNYIKIDDETFLEYIDSNLKKYKFGN